MKRLATIILFLLAGLSIALFFVFRNRTSVMDKLVGSKVPSNTAIVKVGNETIYQKDLDFELSYSPNAQTEDHKKVLVEKLIRDSIILQAGADDKLVSLDSTVFNNLNKDQLRRIELIRKIKDEVENRSDRISGSIVTIWFYNYAVGPLGYEKSKEFAYGKIKGLYDKVSGGQMSIEEAGEAIKNDESLKQIDTAYSSNAILEFDSVKGEKITPDAKFDEVLWNLNPGELTPIIGLKEYKEEYKREVETLYVFAQLKDRKNEGGNPGFEKWFEDKKGQYKIKYEKI